MTEPDPETEEPRIATGSLVMCKSDGRTGEVTGQFVGFGYNVLVYVLLDGAQAPRGVMISNLTESQ